MRNRIAKGKRVGVAILALGLAVVLLFTACAPATTEPPEEEKVVEIGGIFVLTGGGSASDQQSLLGFQDYVSYFNEEEGIPGVTIKLAWSDGAGKADTLISTYRRFRGSDISVMFSNSQFLPVLESTLEKDKVVMFSNNADEMLVYPAGWIYVSSPTWTEQFAVWCDYVMDNWKEERPPRLAIIGADYPFMWGIVSGGTKYAESIGIEMLPTETIPPMPLDTTTQLLRLKETGADFVYVQWITVVTLPVLLDAERLKLFDQIHFGGNAFSIGERAIQKAGAAAEGFFMPKTQPGFDETELPGIQLMVDTQMKYRGKIINEPEYMAGWKAAAIVCEAVRRTVEEVGYENIDGPAIKEATESIKDFDVYGLVTVTYTPEDHRGSDSAAIYQVRDGKVIRVTDWKEAPIIVPEK